MSVRKISGRCPYCNLGTLKEKDTGKVECAECNRSIDKYSGQELQSPLAPIRRQTLDFKHF